MADEISGDREQMPGVGAACAVYTLELLAQPGHATPLEFDLRFGVLLALEEFADEILAHNRSQAAQQPSGVV